MAKKPKSSAHRKQRVDWPSATAADLMRAFNALGFEMLRISGSHYYYSIPGYTGLEFIQIPFHGKVSFRPETVKEYWKRANKQKAVTAEEFLLALK